MSEKALEIKPKDFQKDMIEIVSEQISKELNEEDKLLRNEIHIVSPTGSGKTFMMKEVLKTFFEADSAKNIVILWLSTSTGGLLNQSYQTFKETFEESQIDVIKIEELLKKKNNENKIVFTSWESINSKKTNTIYQPNENQSVGLEEFLFKNSDIKFIGIIDESHRNISDKDSKSSDAYNMFNCELTIHLTATPILQEVENFKDLVNSNPSEKNFKVESGKWIYVVKEKDVKKSGLISEETLYNINPDGGDYFEPETEFVSIELGLKRLRQLQEVSHRYNPLMLIQLSNEGPKNTRIKTEKLPQIEKILQRENINYRIWLNKDDDQEKKYILSDSEKDEIRKVNSSIEVLIFKQAVAVGWDCPRAKILVKERDTKSKTFDEQVLGRIRRIPGGDHYYDHPDLIYSYVYSHHIKDSKGDNPPKLGDLNNTQLTNEIQNLGQKPFAIPIFSKSIDAELCYDKLLAQLKNYNFDGFDENKETYVSTITAARQETFSEYLNEVNSLKINNSILAIKSKVFYDVLKIKHHFNKGVSPLLIIQILHDCFSEKFGSRSYEETYTLIANNQELINNYLSKLFKEMIKEVYLPKLNDEKFYTMYPLPTSLIYNNTEESGNNLKDIIKEGPLISLYIYEEKFVADRLQSTEISFIEKLNQKARHSNIKYWFKNSTKNDSFFMMRSDGKRFFPDFLIQLEDGSVWIYEIKGYGDFNIEKEDEMKIKKEALDLYIEYARVQGYQIHGEIISSKDNQWYRWDKDIQGWKRYELFDK